MSPAPRRGCPSPPWPSRLGGTGSSPGGRGRPSRRLGGTCLHWSSLVSPGGLAAARGRVLGAPELRSRRAGRSAWGTAGAEPVQCHGQAPGGAQGAGGGCTTPTPAGRGVIFSAPRCGFGVLWFLPWLARVRQGTGRCESDGGGIRCRLTSGGPGEVRGAPPGSPGCGAKAAGCQGLVWVLPPPALVWGSPGGKCSPCASSGSSSGAGVAQQPWGRCPPWHRCLWKLHAGTARAAQVVPGRLLWLELRWLCRGGHRAARRAHVHPQLLWAGKRSQNLSRGAGRGLCACTRMCTRVPMCTLAVLSRPLTP